MHIHDFSLNVLQADFSRQSSDLLTTREIEDWLKILHGLVQFRVLKSMLKHEGSEFVYGAVAQHKLESFWPCGGGKQGGGSNHHTPDDLALRSRGRRIHSIMNDDKSYIISPEDFKIFTGKFQNFRHLKKNLRKIFNIFFGNFLRNFFNNLII